VVLRAVLFHINTVPETNPLPVTVRMNAAPPAVTPPGDDPDMVGGGAVIGKLNGAVNNPFWETVIETAPAVAIRAEGTAAVNTVELTKVVARGVPTVAAFHLTTAPVTKLAPLTVKVNAEPPAAADAGDKEEIVGGVAPLVTVNWRVCDIPPKLTLLFPTKTGNWPAVVSNDAGTAAERVVELTYVVARFHPFNTTSLIVLNPEPFAVIVAADPAGTDAGVMEVRTGFTERMMLMLGRSELPPSGFVTDTRYPPEIAISDAGTLTVNWVALTKAVGSVVVPNVAVAPCWKPEPVSVSVKPGPPAVT
jgi:hypothetical protein